MEQKCKYQCTVENNRIIAATTAFTGTDDQNQNTIHHLTIAGRTRVQPIDFDYRTNLPHSRYNINTDQRHTLSNRTVALVVTFPLLQPVLRIRIRIHRIHMFLGLPDPDPLVRGMDPDPDPSIIMQK
jgi:hypothetical protein